MIRPVELKYQVAVNATENGEVEQTVKTPFNKDLNDVEIIVIEKTDTSIKQFSIYPNGCYIYSETVAGSARIRTNFPIEKDDDGNLIIVEPKE